MEGKLLNNYAIFDDKLMIIEQNPKFPKEILGDIGSILYHSNKALNDEQFMIDVQFEKSNITLMKNKDIKTSICALNTKK